MTADDFLWSTDPSGVFAPASVEVRRELEAEQLRFVWSVFQYDPMAVIKSSSKNVLGQIASMGLGEFSSDGSRNINLTKLPMPYQKAFQESASYRGEMPIALVSFVQWVTFGLALLVLFLVFFSSRWLHRVNFENLTKIGILILGVAVNAAVCGVLSGPHDRYAARVAWLLPFAALTVVFCLKRRHAAGHLGY
jgi:hypothetical protein